MNAWISVVELVSLPLLVLLGKVYLHFTGFLLTVLVSRVRVLQWTRLSGGTKEQSKNEWIDVGCVSVVRSDTW